jgi:hypothetical protein
MMAAHDDVMTTRLTLGLRGQKVLRDALLHPSLVLLNALEDAEGTLDGRLDHLLGTVGVEVKR